MDRLSLLVALLCASISLSTAKPSKPHHKSSSCGDQKDCESCIKANILKHPPGPNQKVCIWCNNPTTVLSGPACLAVKNLNPNSCPDLDFNLQSCSVSFLAVTILGTISLILFLTCCSFMCFGLIFICIRTYRTSLESRKYVSYTSLT